MRWPLCALLAAMALAACAREPLTVTVDPAKRHQTMRGWEVTVDMTDDANPRGFPPFTQALLARAVDEVGIDRVRLEVRSGAENTDRNWTRFTAGALSQDAWRPLRYATVNDNDDPDVIAWSGFDFAELDANIETVVLPLRARLAARGERLFVNLCYVAFTVQLEGGAYHHDDPEEYAEFVLATYLHMRDKYGFTPDAWEVLLEPDNHTRQWSPQLMGEAIVAAARKLRENGFTPAFIAPSVTDMANAAPWIDEIARVDGAMAEIVEFSYHRYRNGSRAHAARIAARGARHNKPTAMLEWWFGLATPAVLYEDLTVANASAWQGQTIRMLFNVDQSDAAAPAFSIADDTRLNRLYFQAARIGAHRIEAHATDRNAAKPVAFLNPDGAAALVIAVDGARDVALAGLPPGVYAAAYELTDGGGGALAPVTIDAAGRGQLRTPGRGIVSLRSRGAR